MSTKFKTGKGGQKQNPNDLLHAHVTRVGFDLTLGRTHIAALVFLDMSFAHNRTWHNEWNRTPYAGAYRNFIGGISGLIGRGLVIHHWVADDVLAKRMARRARGEQMGLQGAYSFTRAGELVVELLKESGVYAEYAVVLPVSTRKSA